MRKFIFSLSIACLAACASKPYPLSSPHYRIPEGSRLLLKRALTIAPEKGRVTIQYGKVATGSKLDQYYPHCWFVSWVLSTNETIIKPGQFIVTGSRKYESYVNKQNPGMLASRGDSYTMGMSASITAIEHFTELMIHSDKQPEIRQFICNHWEDPLDSRHLTVAEINQTLGDIAELKPLNME